MGDRRDRACLWFRVERRTWPLLSAVQFLASDAARAYGDCAAFVVAVIVAPVVEETYFRGWIFTSLRQSWGRWPAVIISALLFGLAHYKSTHLYALAVFPLGLILAALRERTGSAGTSMLFHAANNLIAVLSAATSST